MELSPNKHFFKLSSQNKLNMLVTLKHFYFISISCFIHQHNSEVLYPVWFLSAVAACDIHSSHIGQPFTAASQGWLPISPMLNSH